MQVNPLNVTGQRLLTWLPEHFVAVKVSDVNSQQIHKISSWIYKNLQQRYCIVSADDYASIVFGFESGSEASFFQLILPSIK